jgi:hypothetical protein
MQKTSRRRGFLGMLLAMPVLDALAQGQCLASGVTMDEILATWDNNKTKAEFEKTVLSVVVHRKEKALFKAVRKGVGETEEIGLLGEMFVNTKSVGTVVEHEGMRIPAGSYRGIMRYVSAENKKIVQGPLSELAVTGDFLLEITGVKGRTALLVHQGTKPQHSEGCILAGAAVKRKVKYKDKDGKEREKEILTISDDSTLHNLRQAFYGKDEPVACPNKIIRIDIKDI